MGSGTAEEHAAQGGQASSPAGIPSQLRFRAHLRIPAPAEMETQTGSSFPARSARPAARSDLRYGSRYSLHSRRLKSTQQGFRRKGSVRFIPPISIMRVMERSPLLAGTAIAPNARARGAPSGSKAERPNCCLSNTFTSSSQGPRRSLKSPFSTKRWSTTFCSAPPPKRCSPSPAPPDIRAPASAFSPCFIPGGRTCCTTRNPRCVTSTPVSGIASPVPKSCPPADPMPHWRGSDLRRAEMNLP